MRAMWIAAGFGVLAVGMVFGVVVAGFSPGAEAAPPDKSGDAGGRLIELGTMSGGFAEYPLVDVSDCERMLVMAEGEPGAAIIEIQGTIHVSPDGTNDNRISVATLLTESGTSANVDGTPSSSLIVEGLAPYMQFTVRSTAGAQDITTWVWCSFR